MQSHVSTQTEYPSFCFPADLVFQERTSICVNVAYSSLLNCEHLPVHKINSIQFMNTFQHPVHAHFIVAGM